MIEQNAAWEAVREQKELSIYDRSYRNSPTGHREKRYLLTQKRTTTPTHRHRREKAIKRSQT